jgi:hypothetical protein
MDRKEVEKADLDKLADLGALSEEEAPLGRTVRVEFLLRQTKFQEQQAIAAQEAARAAERQALAAERAADATGRYTRFTFWLLVASVITAAAAVISLFRS